MSIVINILMVLLVALCLLMLLIILMQRPKQEGLGTAFSGGMMDGMLGSGTTNFLQKATVYLTVGYFALTMALDVILARTSEARSLQGRNLEVPAAAASPAKEPEAVAPVTIEAPEAGDESTTDTPDLSTDATDTTPTPTPTPTPDDAEAGTTSESTPDDVDATTPENGTGDESPPPAEDATTAPDTETSN